MKTNYAEKLKDPRWQKKRLGVLERDKWKCRKCGDNSKTLHVHHGSYRGGNPWDAADDELETLCESCHTVETIAQTIDRCEKMGFSFEIKSMVKVTQPANAVTFEEMRIADTFSKLLNANRILVVHELKRRGFLEVGN